MAELEHLKLIQGVIARLAGNSFLLKGWAVTLVAGLTALAKTDSDRGIAWIACGVVLVFALLDAYYLALERAFRGLYADAADDTKGVPVWTLQVAKPGPREILRALSSLAVWPLYLAAGIGAILVAVVI